MGHSPTGYDAVAPGQLTVKMWEAKFSGRDAGFKIGLGRPCVIFPLDEQIIPSMWPVWDETPLNQPAQKRAEALAVACQGRLLDLR